MLGMTTAAIVEVTGGKDAVRVYSSVYKQIEAGMAGLIACCRTFMEEKIMVILVSGGTGYVGGYTSVELQNAGQSRSKQKERWTGRRSTKAKISASIHGNGRALILIAAAAEERAA